MTPERIAELRSVARMARPDYGGLAPVGIQRDAIDALPECLNEIDRLRKALSRYGRHESTCPHSMTGECQCGLFDALK